MGNKNNKKDIIISGILLTILTIAGIICSNYNNETSTFIFILVYAIIILVFYLIIMKVL